MTAITRLPGEADVAAIKETIDNNGVVVTENFFSKECLHRYNSEVQPLIDEHHRTYTGVETFDDFLGYNKVRLQGLAATTPSFIDALIDPRLLGVMDHLLLPLCADYLLSAGELIEIRQNETTSRLHTHNNSRPTPVQSLGYLCVNAVIALTDYTAENGATQIAPGSHLWTKGRLPEPDEIVPAEMPAGSVAIFTGETIHGGGTSYRPRHPPRPVRVLLCRLAAAGREPLSQPQHRSGEGAAQAGPADSGLERL
ncbi:MAG: hypothetical protein CMM46_15770 [Rhodospirillaceae bacterium]|nr:hypothetical protein [Rhodospirillaceae bacterium]|tara:strand:- start:15605 stop:16366 length:762 start_codon:yes stop_codon:yes gene_type:complete